jgi:hypothetical protein
MVRQGREATPNPAVRDFFDRRYRAFLAMHEQERALKRILEGRA